MLTCHMKKSTFYLFRIEFSRYLYEHELMKQMTLDESCSGERSPTSPHRMDFHISVAFSLNRLRFSKLSLFKHKIRAFLSNNPFTLRNQAYSNILRISPLKTESFQIKNSDIFHISAQNIDCGYSLEPPRRSGSNEYPQSMFLSRNKKNNVYPCKPQFYYIKVGFKGVKNT